MSSQGTPTRSGRITPSASGGSSTRTAATPPRLPSRTRATSFGSPVQPPPSIFELLDNEGSDAPAGSAGIAEESVQMEAVEGTYDNPFKFTVNRHFPELNPFGLLPIRVPHYEVGDKQYTVWQLAAFVAHHDYEKMSAYTTDMADTILLIMPAVGFWLNVKRLLSMSCFALPDATKHPFLSNEAVMSAHRRQNGATADDPSRQNVHLLVKFPVDHPLDNNVMAPNEEAITKKCLFLKKTEKTGEHTPDGKEVANEFKALVAYWEIAEKAGQRTGTQKKRGDDIVSLMKTMNM